ncbi:hypothetical protein [Psychromicrobium sp. YIM B11713]|uniref:hypothetical protein n=1 Tax=Psychromicrobium sp. YIM B11713 TaxID=3145233 RepID=UPI00374E5422
MAITTTTSAISRPEKDFAGTGALGVLRSTEDLTALGAGLLPADLSCGLTGAALERPRFALAPLAFKPLALVPLVRALPEARWALVADLPGATLGSEIAGAFGTGFGELSVSAGREARGTLGRRVAMEKPSSAERWAG